MTPPHMTHGSASPVVAERAVDPARICAAWAGSGEFGDHVVYECDGVWTFAARPVAHLTLTRDRVSVKRPQPDSAPAETVEIDWDGDPVTALTDALDLLSGPWRVYGWVGFDFCAARHRLLRHVPADVVIAHLIVPGLTVTVDADGVHADHLESTTRERLLALAETAGPPAGSAPVDVSDDADGYRERVTRAVDEIRRGDYQKVILSRRVDLGFDVDMPATYVRGREANTPARSFLLRLGGLEAAGFSPELVLAVDVDGTVRTEPLAGTRALIGVPAADAAARDELLTDEKELAEHAISVRESLDEMEEVSRPGTARVTDFLGVRERGSVQHLGSTVRGVLDDDVSPWRALETVFPSVTATGIPKGRALAAAYRLEPGRRGPYSGAVLTASSAGDLDAALTLRTVFAEHGVPWLRAGAGVVAMSTADREFEETCEKLASVAPHVVPAESNRRGSDRAAEGK